MTDTVTPDLETFRQLFSDWDEALVADDPARIAAFAAPGWTFLSQDGPFAGRGFLESVAAGVVSHDTMRSEVHSVAIFGDVAIVVARVVNSGTYRGERFVNDEWTSDVFVRSAGRWLCELTHLTPARA
ncbi:nuclear transport factor 2 family protein [Nocardia sp. NPDC003345]